MSRTVIVKLSDGREQPYANVPDDVTDDQIRQKAEADYNGLKAVKIISEDAPAAVSEPSEAAPETSKGPRSTGFEQELKAYYKDVGEGKELFEPARLEALGKKYNLRIGNIPEVQKAWEERRSLNPVPSYLSTVQTSEQIEQPKPATPEDVIRTGGAGSNWVNRARAFGAGALFNFADEAEAAVRTLTNALADGEISWDEYYRQKNQINDAYQNWANANPNEALSYEVGGGLATAFLPVGLAARGAQGATRLAQAGRFGKGVEAVGGALSTAGQSLVRGAQALPFASRIASPGGRMLISGGLAGGVAGAGEAERMSDIPLDAAIGAGLGAGTGLGLGKLFEYGGRGAGRLYDLGKTALGGGAPASTPAERGAARILTQGAESGGTSVDDAIKMAEMRQTYGLDGPLATATPEMADLGQVALATPSAGRRGLLKSVGEQQAGSKARVRDLLDKGFGSPTDYFATEDALTENLRKNANTMYQKAYSFGEVRDPEIMRILQKPVFSKYLKKAADLAELDDAPLKTVMEPIINKAGDVVGLRATNQTIPDVQTLDYIKQALDSEINKLYKAGDNAEAKLLRKNRDALLARLDNLVPDFKAARAQYKGDIEVREALQDGLVFNKMNSKQIAKKWADMSEAEREAFRTGALQAFFSPMDKANTQKNFAQNIMSKEKLDVLQTILPPDEYNFVRTGLDLESEAFQRATHTYSGSRSVPLALATQAIDEIATQGDFSALAEAVLGDKAGLKAAFTRWVVQHAPGAGLKDEIYTKLSQALSAKNKDELAAVADMIARSESYVNRTKGVQNLAAGRVAAAGGNVGDVYFTDRPAAIPPAPTAESGPTQGELQEQFYQAVDTPYTVEGTAIGEPEEAAEDGQAPFDPFQFKAGMVTSGRRTPEGNVAVGGVPTSKHVTGGGIDYVPAQGQSMEELARQAKAHFGNAAKVINEGDHVHIEVHGFTGMPYYGKRGTQGK